MKKFTATLLFIVFIINSCDEINKSIKIDSPSGNIRIILRNDLNSLAYSVLLNNKEVITNSKLGILFKNNRFNGRRIS